LHDDAMRFRSLNSVSCKADVSVRGMEEDLDELRETGSGNRWVMSSMTIRAVPAGGNGGVWWCASARRWARLGAK
jgi:hypothetical protein